MSYMEIKGLWPGSDRIEVWQTLRNSHGGACVIWDLMAQRYCGCKPLRYSCICDDQFWGMLDRKDISAHHRNVFAMTGDNCMILAKDYERAAQDIRRFLAEMPYPSDYVNHWPVIATFLESAPDCPAVGFYWSSVGDDFWDSPCKGDSNEREPFDWNRAVDVYAGE